MSQNQTANNTWRSQTGFIWSLIGSAVGFANILSFSAQAYKNGGGAFLIPYFIALFILGIPLLILEGMIGYRMKSPLVLAYGMACGKIGKILGWLAVLACLSIGGFYIVLTGYSVAYTYFSAVNAIPEDTKSFFVHTFLKTTSSITDFGQISIPLFASTFAVAILTWFVLVRNVRDGIERICSFFMPLLALVVTLFAVAACILPGGMKGWFYYLNPDFSKLLDPSLWRDVFGQLFFSLSLGLGIIVGYSRHTGQATNIPKAMLYVALGDFLVSFIAGAAIFCCLAHISYVQQIPFESILKTDSTFEIGFVIFPQIMKFFGPVFAQWIGVVESIAGNIEIELSVSRKRAVTFTVASLMVLATFFCMGNASYLMDALVPMVIGTHMLIGGLALIIAFQYSCDHLKKDPIWSIGTQLSPFGFCLRYIAPILLSLILIGNLLQEFQAFDLSKAIRWSWFILALFISWFLA
jgi:NSS family neurotransmitter:Na+ symporter